MALGSNKPKQPTRAEIIQEAAAMDARRQEQIRNQTMIINRLLEVNQVYEGALESMKDTDERAGEALDQAVKINERHRKQKEKQDGK